MIKNNDEGSIGRKFNNQPVIKRGYQPTKSLGGSKNMPVKPQGNGNVSQGK